jgi:iron(III) transport system substrate-binding protein
MKLGLWKSCALMLLTLLCLVGEIIAAESSANRSKTNQPADAKGYTFIGSHDEIVAKAKKEGKVRVTASIDPAKFKIYGAAFQKKYPFIDIDGRESTGPDVAQRILREIQSGAAKEWDVILVYAEFRSEYTPHLWNVDLLGMAKQGVLQIPPAMIDSKYGNVISPYTHFQVTAYNPKLVSAEILPKTWDDFLKPELLGRKFAVDTRPKDVAALVPAWGLEKTINFARKLAGQQPIWVLNPSRTLVSIMAGEIPMMMGANFKGVKGAQRKDRIGALQYSIPEPVPVRFGNLQGIAAAAQRPHAALLWLEWLASPEAQKLIDEHEPFNSSLYVPSGAVAEELKNRKLSLTTWENHHFMEQWEGKIVEAYGFPKGQ